MCLGDNQMNRLVSRELFVSNFKCFYFLYTQSHTLDTTEQVFISKKIIS